MQHRHVSLRFGGGSGLKQQSRKQERQDALGLPPHRRGEWIEPPRLPWDSRSMYLCDRRWSLRPLRSTEFPQQPSWSLGPGAGCALHRFAATKFPQRPCAVASTASQHGVPSATVRVAWPKAGLRSRAFRTTATGAVRGADSVAAQCAQGVDPRGAPRRNQAGEGGDHGEESGDGDVKGRVDGRHREEQ